MKNPSITVALSALNEEANIKKFLESVLSQKEEGFILEKILIISDGSTDRTVEIAKSFNSQKIVIRNYKERKGKSYRLNEIYKTLTSDILIQSDADVVLAGNFVFRDLVKAMEEDKNIGMVSGHSKALPGVTFTQKAVICTFDAYANMRKYNDSLSVTGCLLGYKKEFAKKITIPANMIGNDVYTYFLCITSGFKYKYVPAAISYFKIPETLEDHIKQNTRFEAVPSRMSEYFGSEIIKREEYIPIPILLKSFGLQFIKHPIHCSYIFVVNFYCKIRAELLGSRLTGKWTMVSSTKKLDNVNI